jgi:uncharacterized protein YheU (UPF0270 family)
VVEEFATRDGTDYGETWVSLEDKVQQVLSRLRRGEATLWFDPKTRSTHIVAAP